MLLASNPDPRGKPGNIPDYWPPEPKKELSFVAIGSKDKLPNTDNWYCKIVDNDGLIIEAHPTVGCYFKTISVQYVGGEISFNRNDTVEYVGLGYFISTLTGKMVDSNSFDYLEPL